MLGRCVRRLTLNANIRATARHASIAGAVVASVLGLAASPAAGGVANAGLPHAPRSNPLAGMAWGVYRGPFYNSIFPSYQTARGPNRQLLAKIALRPLMFTFGDWFADSQAKSVARDFIQSTTGGNPAVLSQVAIFRLDPWEGAACPNGSWNAANQRSYRAWVDNFAAGIGSSRVALVLQPDLPFAMCARSKVPLQLVNYAAQRFNALLHTTVYVDAGARYFPPFSQAVSMLEQAGIRYARGFALNTSEYDTTGSEIEYGARLAQALATAGYPGRHFVVSTAENGAGFLNGQYPGDVNHPRVCRNRFDHLCVTLGIPPTTQVASPRWHLSGSDGALASRYVDAYVWAGRPWLFGAAGQFDLQRALGLAASTPF
jgi:endoglucanase